MNCPYSNLRKYLALSSLIVLAACSQGKNKIVEKSDAPPPPGEVKILTAESVVTDTADSTLEVMPARKVKAAEEQLVADVQTPVDPLIAQPMTNDAAMERIRVLEETVQTLRADYNQLLPAFNQLIVTNERLQKVLEAMTAEKGLSAPMMKVSGTAEPAAIKMPENKQGHSPAQTQAQPLAASIQDVRIGDHKTKARIVFDVLGSTDYTIENDKTEQLLTVSFSDADWKAMQGKTGSASPLVVGWSVQDTENGVMAVMQLSKAVKVLSHEGLPPISGKPARIYVDIAPL